MDDSDARRKPVGGGSRWQVLTAVLLPVVGVLWIAGFYVSPEAPVLGALGNWNLLIGFALVITGVVLGVVLLVKAAVAPRRRA
ncbi:cell division protein CrgA [Sphaerisporangium sp. NPDC049003]|uniref:cell division protein CrgA n=1 Tax=Sphaerisporangium sp. NPDC049003 TaxID=3364517 RepID=UPI00372227E2